MKTKHSKTKSRTKAGRTASLRSGTFVRRFRVWIEQVNQTYVDVSATDEESASDKAYRKWRREDAHARIGAIKQLGASSPNSEDDRRRSP